ncbi:hypothetical protein PIROE2DRAFT_3244 [Piromyces sp. E2]|nr:hypothetical protein PIROE2DRAFT_3244 [Piromyces sp. E2]|eukprot:OUM69005.1 hypothetical protein PIROE2DRAFT_3244 [Piromyces sp. E2]
MDYANINNIILEVNEKKKLVDDNIEIDDKEIVQLLLNYANKNNIILKMHETLWEYYSFSWAIKINNNVSENKIILNITENEYKEMSTTLNEINELFVKYEYFLKIIN